MKLGFFRRWRIATLTALAAIMAIARGAGVSFPGTKSCASPDGRWQITCDSKTSADGSGLHSLYLARVDGTGRALLYVSDRWCEILWNPGADTVAVTDWEASNVSSVFLVDLRAPKKKQNLGDVVPSISQPLSQSERTGHIYWEALEWKSAEKMLVRIFGHTDEANGHEFCYTFGVNLRERTCVLVAKDLSEGAETAIWKAKQSSSADTKQSPR